MFLDVQALDLQGSGHNVKLEGVPDVCPLCRRSVHPKHITSVILVERSVIQALYRCTDQKCQELFIGTYDRAGKTLHNRPVYTLINVAPKNAEEVPFPELITNTSPDFVGIYNQALAAECARLDQLVGIGLRKALEFLIKDFAIQGNPSEKDSIRRMMLGPCIDKYVSDTNVKECAKRAAWLGNDETHYTRKWEDKDIEDLKILVRLTVNWIENVLLTQKYCNEMPPGKTPENKAGGV